MFNFKFDTNNKRKIVILSLIFVLLSISYLNYMINKKSLLETSSDFEEYEEKQLSELEKDNVVVHENIENEEKATSSITLDNNNIVDSKESNFNDIVAVSNSNIEDNILKENKSSSNYFLQAKIDMEVEREKTIERFNEIINNNNIDKSLKKEAVDKKMKLIDIINKEKIIESLVKGKGFENALVFITEKSVYVTIDSDELADTDIAKILDIVTRETEVSIDNIKIQKK